MARVTSALVIALGLWLVVSVAAIAAPSPPRASASPAAPARTPPPASTAPSSVDRTPPVIVQVPSGLGPTIAGAVVGAIAALAASWLTINSERHRRKVDARRQAEKYWIWSALRAAGVSLSLERLAARTELSESDLLPLVYELLQDGMIFEGATRDTYSTSPRESVT